MTTPDPIDEIREALADLERALETGYDLEWMTDPAWADRCRVLLDALDEMTRLRDNAVTAHDRRTRQLFDLGRKHAEARSQRDALAEALRPFAWPEQGSFAEDDPVTPFTVNISSFGDRVDFRGHDLLRARKALEGLDAT